MAKTAGVGKGTIYDYFKNKEDIVFEIVTILMQKRNLLKEEKLSKATTTKEKVKIFFNFFYDDEDVELRQIYKEFLSISLINPDKQMLEFNSSIYANYISWVEKIIQEGISSGEIIAKSEGILRGLFAYTQGVFVSSLSTDSFSNVEKIINDYIEEIFELIEVKNA